MASFFVWMAWWCRAVLMHRTRWSFLESLPQPLPKGKGFGAALTGIFLGETKRRRDKESKRRRDKETKSQRDGETERRGVKESKRRRDEESAQRLFDGFEQGLNRVCSMVVQWSFNGRSMVVQWSFNGCSMVVQWLVLFSWKAWQKTGYLALMSVRVRFCTRLSCIFLTFSSRCHQVGEEKSRCGVERCQ